MISGHETRPRVDQRRLYITIDTRIGDGIIRRMKRKRRPIDLAEQLRKAFARSRMTRYELGKRAGVPYATIHRFVAGERDIRLTTASRLADVLGVEFRPTRTSPAPRRKGR